MGGWGGGGAATPLLSFLRRKVKMYVFQLLSTIKVNLVDEMMQRSYLCVIVHVKHKKLPFITVLTLFLILGKI